MLFFIIGRNDSDELTMPSKKMFKKYLKMQNPFFNFGERKLATSDLRKEDKGLINSKGNCLSGFKRNARIGRVRLYDSQGNVVVEEQLAAKEQAIWLTADPLAEKYRSMSPYAYCGNQPMNRIDLDGRDWYESTKLNSNNQKSIFWQEGNAATVENDGVTYNNIGETYTHHNGNVSTTYQQNEAVSMTERVLSPNNFASQVKADGSGLKSMPDGNCFVQAGKMVSSTGATSIDNVSGNISDIGKGMEYLNSQIDKGYSARVHVDRTNDGQGDHWVAISSRTTDLRTNKVTSFGFYDPATRHSSKGTNNSFNVNGNTMTGRPAYNSNFFYNAVHIRRNK